MSHDQQVKYLEGWIAQIIEAAIASKTGPKRLLQSYLQSARERSIAATWALIQQGDETRFNWVELQIEMLEQAIEMVAQGEK